MLGDNHPDVNSQTPAPFEVSEKINFLIDCLDRGWHIFPLHDLIWHDGTPSCTCHLGPRCPGPGKHPLAKWSVPLDPAEQQSRIYVHAVCERWPHRGFGLHVGLSGLVVLDIDPRHGGNEALSNLCKQMGIILPGASVNTGGGGQHYYFSAPAEIDPRRGFVGPMGDTRTMLTLAPGVELFAGQHYVVLPYAPHASGGWYTQGLRDRPEPMPDTLISLARDNPTWARAAPASPHVARPEPRSATVCGPASPAVDCQAEARARAWLDKREPAITGQKGRKRTAATASALVVEFGLSLEAALRLLVAWNTANVPPWDIDQLREILGWADGRSGERGHKLRTGQMAPRLGRAEDLTWLDQVGLDLRIGNLIHHTDPGGDCWLTVLPREPIITAEELASISVTVLDAHLAQVRDRRHSEGCQPTEEPTPWDDLVGEPDTPVVIPSDEPAIEPPTDYLYDAGPSCTCSFRVLLRRSKKNQLRVCNLPGRRWDCPSCGPRRRKHYCATMRHWLNDWAEQMGGQDEPSLFTAIVPAAAWPRVASSIRGRHGQFFKIDHLAVAALPGGSYRVVSTERTRHVQWDAITPRDAVVLLETCIMSMPNDIRVRVWWSSRLWKLLPDRPPKGPEWDRVGRLRASWKDIEAVIDRWALQKKNIRGEGRFWAWSGYQATYPPGMWEFISSDLDDGAPIWKIAMEMGYDPYDPDLGNDGASLIPDFP